MPGSMSGVGGNSGSLTTLPSSSLLHKRPSLCSPTAPPGVGAHHRRSSLQHNLPVNLNKMSFRDAFHNKDKKDESRLHIDLHRNSSKISVLEEKSIVICSAAESGSSSVHYSASSSCSSAQSWPSDTIQPPQQQHQSSASSSDDSRPRTPVDDQRISVPDSTTSQLEGKQSYSSGDDVFVKQKDGRYYLGTVMRSSPGGERWLVRFGDETERWAGGTELRPLAMGCDDGEETVLCVVCKVRGTNSEVVACDQCGRGYHRHCHSSDNDALSPPPNHTQGMSWQCKRCVEQRYKVAASESRALRREMLKTQRQISKPPDTLPYNINSLHWDAQHRENSESKYCYCGKLGNWYKKMLQCHRCRQWFHQNCISCLRHPLYTGDRFYFFVCSLCNYGNEFVRRLELEWADLVHLMIFNLTSYNMKKYYDLDSVVIPYIMDNWYALQLPEKMQAITPSQRREQIVLALTGNRNRFKCGRETKKRASIWGLRSRDPPAPPLPSAPIPTRGPITEAMLTTRLTFLPEHDSPTSSQDLTKENRMIVPIDSHWLSVMTGKRFQDNSVSSDNDSLRSTPSPVDNIMSRSRNRINLDDADIFTKKRDRSPCEFDSLNDTDKNSTPVVKRKELKLYEMNYQGCGFVKKSVPFPKLTLNSRKKFLDTLRQRCKSKDSVKQEVDLEKEEVFHNKSTKLLRTRLSKQQKDSPSTKTHMSIGTNTPPVEDETVFTLINTRTLNNNKTESSCSSIKNSKESSHYCYGTTKREVVLPPTPPTSVSAPPTPPANTGELPSSGSSSNDVPPDFQQKKSIHYDSDQEKSVQSNSSSETVCVVPIQKTPTKSKPKDASSPKKDKSPLSLNGVITNGHTSKLAAINLEISKLSTKNIIEHSKIMSLHHINDPFFIFKAEHDSSGDDTSSRGTLDSIIPPPANFQGKNNPFHWQANSNSIASKLFSRHSFSKVQTSVTTNCTKNQRISLPVNLNPVIAPPARPLKRHLSEKDLVIGPNGEVKRRRLRRPRKALQNPQSQNTKDQIMTERQRSLRSSFGQDTVSEKINGDQQSSSTTTVNIEVNIQQLNTCVEYTQNGRTLRQRQEKNYCDSRRGSTSSNNANNLLSLNTTNTLNISTSSNSAGNCTSGVRSLNLSPQKMSPFKNNQSNSVSAAAIDDLKNSMHSYFGAMNRITAGEKFTLIGKRLTDNGTVQYLIEWEGHGS